MLFKKKRLPGNQASGLWGEAVAGLYLKKQGFKILARRLKVGHDELDLVVRGEGCVVFVEVKTRRSRHFGAPASAVDRRKRHAVSRAAVHYLKKNRFPEESIRFDVVEVIGEPDGEPEINHIRNAFTLDRCFRLPY